MCQIKTIVVHRELFIPFKCIARSDGMTKQMRIVQIGKEQHYSLCTEGTSYGTGPAMEHCRLRNSKTHARKNCASVLEVRSRQCSIAGPVP